MHEARGQRVDAGSCGTLEPVDFQWCATAELYPPRARVCSGRQASVPYTSVVRVAGMPGAPLFTSLLRQCWRNNKLRCVCNARDGRVRSASARTSGARAAGCGVAPGTPVPKTLARGPHADPFSSDLTLHRFELRELFIPLLSVRALADFGGSTFHLLREKWARRHVHSPRAR